MRKTKIICTLGPAVDSEEMLKELILHGMDCARLNFSHGSHEEQKERIDKIKKLRKELDIPIPLLLDTKGPEIRVCDFENGSIDVEEGDVITLSHDNSIIGTKEIVGLTYPNLSRDISIGTRILVDDGKVALSVVDIKGKDVVCKVENGGKISNHKSINVPNVEIEMPYVSEVDRNDIIFGIEQGIDFIAASFVRRADDILQIRKILKEYNAEDIQIIAKIENMQGILNLTDIINVSDGIMVARGDMGVEIPFKKLPAIQKNIIERCYAAGKFVITATQMLESMTKNPRPTRAEVSDVANAIYDGTTIIMLSGESAAGKYPIEAVRTMAEIAESTESSINYKKRFHANDLNLGNSIINAIANSACISSYQLNAKAIIAVTRGGVTARIVAGYRPECPVIAATLDDRSCRQLNLAWNVRPISAEVKTTTDAIFEHGVERAKATGLVKDKDLVIITGSSVISETGTDVIRINRV